MHLLLLLLVVIGGLLVESSVDHASQFRRALDVQLAQCSPGTLQAVRSATISCTCHDDIRISRSISFNKFEGICIAHEMDTPCPKRLRHPVTAWANKVTLKYGALLTSNTVQ